MKIKLTMVLVAAFLMWLLFAFNAERAQAQPVLSLGHTALNSHNSVGEVGWQLPGGRWELAASVIGQESRGDPHQYAYSLSRLVRPQWDFLGGQQYFRIGAAYVDGSPLVGDINYRLGLGLEWGVVAVEYFHYSSAGINDPNTGIDGILLRVPL